MSSNKPIKGPGRGGAAFRSGPMVENPGKMLKRLLAYIVKNYRIHIILVVIGIVVSVEIRDTGFPPSGYGNPASCLLLCHWCRLYLYI